MTSTSGLWNASSWPAVSPSLPPRRGSSPRGVLLSIPAAARASWCLLLWRQPIRGLTSFVSRARLTGRPQRLPALSTAGGGRLPRLKWMLLAQNPDWTWTGPPDQWNPDGDFICLGKPKKLEPHFHDLTQRGEKSRGLLGSNVNMERCSRKHPGRCVGAAACYQGPDAGFPHAMLILTKKKAGTEAFMENI